jgi:hypothetical protein
MDTTKKNKKTKPSKPSGRKPKNTVVSASKCDDIIDNIIIKLTPMKTDTSLLPGPAFETSMLPGPVTMSDDDLTGGGDTTISSVPQLCWNCNDTQCASIGIPYKRHQGVYYVTGKFCSYECGARYIYDTYENKDIWERYSLLNMYYNDACGTQGECVKMSPPRHALQEYGGTLSREDYRQASKQGGHGQYILPPFIPVDYTEYSGGDRVKMGSDTMKLYRLKPVKQNQILESMNITSS